MIQQHGDQVNISFYFQFGGNKASLWHFWASAKINLEALSMHRPEMIAQSDVGTCMQKVSDTKYEIQPAFLGLTAA